MVKYHDISNGCEDITCGGGESSSEIHLKKSPKALQFQNKKIPRIKFALTLSKKTLQKTL